MFSQKKKLNEESELEEIKKGFEMFDTDGTGRIIPSEVKEAMDSMNMKEKNPFIYEVIESLCCEKEYLNNNGISIEDLINYVYEKVNDNETNLGLHQLFDALKDPESETISMHTFIKLAKEYGDDGGLSEDELKYLLEKTQLGGDELTFDEFYTIMKGGGSTSSKSNISMGSYDAYNKKRQQSSLSNITSQDINNSKKEVENENENDNVNNNEKEIENENFNDNDNANTNEKEINIENKTPEKSISIIKNYSNNKLDLESFDKGINQINFESNEHQQQPEKKEENIKKEIKEIKEVNVIKEENVINMKKEEKPIRKYKYNRFKKLDNNNNNNNGTKDNKVVVEEKTISKKNVYRTRRPVYLNNNNNEDNNAQKMNEGNDDKKDVEIPRKYHRRYRENKMSTNIGP